MQPDNLGSGNRLNEVSPDAPRKYSTFPLSYRFLQTQRFAEITPHCSFSSFEGCEDSFRCMADTSTYSLKAPLKTDLYQKRNNFAVPMQAILPNGHEYICIQPVSGDDVADSVNGVVTGKQIYDYLSALVNLLKTHYFESEDEVPVGGYLSGVLRSILMLEQFCSQGSLMKQLKYDFSHLFIAREDIGSGELKSRTFDSFAEQVLSALAPRDKSLTGIWSFMVNFYDADGITDTFTVVPDKKLSSIPISDVNYISFRHFLDLARQNLNFIIYNIDASDVVALSNDDDDIWYVSDEFGSYLFGKYYSTSDDVVRVAVAPYATDFPATINFNMISAYQIVCAHFYSCDYVDYVYTANLYRQLMQFYCDQIVTDPSERVYTRNALQIHYDALSGYYIAKVLADAVHAPDSFFEHDPDVGFFLYSSCYLSALLSFRHNLRYMDYFTGGRTRPLSVGDVGVQVNNNIVNAVDMVIGTNSAKYLNWAQRIGQKFSKWFRKKSGIEPAHDYHDPQWLSGTGDLVIVDNVQNTGDSQATEANSITAQLKANTNRYQFSFTADRPSYIVCVTTYDIPRSYAFATDRENMHANRYDMFNQFFQYNGSQAVKHSELGLLQAEYPFSYQGKYMEFKQKYDICAGGFLEFLPGYAFIADTAAGIPMQRNLNPTYIRSWNAELDDFYLALTGYTLAGYFHFIVKNTNIINAKRPMEYNPQLM